MPLKIGDRTFKKFKHAEAFIRRTKPEVSDPAAYVGAIEHTQKDNRPKHKTERKREKS